MNHSTLFGPVTAVRLVRRDDLHANNYNPNIVLEDNLQLLTRSIQVNGWTLPIVVTADMTIIDGFHRWLVAGREPLLSELGGWVPVVVVDHADPAKNIYGTITHNRARGVHQLSPMKTIVKRLLDQGKTTDEIGRELGMKGEEVFRLSDFSRADFLQLMARNAAGYSPAKVFLRT
jgi:ParB-like chromosome segregation protein Spo0J